MLVFALVVASVQALAAPTSGASVMRGDAKSFYEPKAREAAYGADVAGYLVDLHDARGTFNFCGGMMFQLVLSEQLRARLASVSAGERSDQPVCYDAGTGRMSQTPNYAKTAATDGVTSFQGREVRKVRGAAGGMEFVLHLADGDGQDPEGWSKEEVETYDGWGHDSGRTWRKMDDWEKEGVAGFRDKFGDNAFGLHHRCYFHFDSQNRVWLSAEDGCEGVAQAAGDRSSKAFRINGLF